MSANTTEPQPCTLDTCPASLGFVGYRPTMAGNALFAAIYAIMLLAQVGLGIKGKTWTYLVAMSLGLVLEVVGYVGRIMLYKDPFSFEAFIQYLVCLTIGPAFLTAAIYLTFTRIVYSCDAGLSIIPPVKISIVFMTCDFICLVLQAAGGAITATSNGSSDEAQSQRQQGVNIMIGGLAFHVVSLFFFICYACVFAWRYRSATARSARYRAQHCHGGLRWKALVVGLSVASVTIFARCIYRVAELRDGFDSSLAHDEVAFMVLEGAMIVIACLCLTAFHPGICLDMDWKVDETKTRGVVDDASYADLANVHTSK